MLFVFRYLVDQVVKKRVRIIRLVFVSLQLVSVELSQSCFGAYPDETLFVSEDARTLDGSPSLREICL